MTSELAEHFLALHDGPGPLLMPNPWDAGSARLLASLGFTALATTSSGYAATLGRMDGSVTRDEAIAHGASIAAAVGVPVSADLENGFADDPGEVATTVELAVGAGLAGCSIEDYSTDDGAPIYLHALAVERVAAAAAAAHAGPRQLVLTARAENYLHGRPDLADTIARLQAYADAGADVVYAPGVTAEADIAAIIAAVDVPVNVLLLPGGPSVARLGELGVSRISVGGAFAYAAIAALVQAAGELRSGPSSDFFAQVRAGRTAATAAFT
jgi:2-methylisocitrate lyase-like PEP mutase family enzyme